MALLLTWAPQCRVWLVLNASEFHASYVAVMCLAGLFACVWAKAVCLIPLFRGVFGLRLVPYPYVWLAACWFLAKACCLMRVL